jgi:hypothetical protein
MQVEVEDAVVGAEDLVGPVGAVLVGVDRAVR